MSSSGHRGGPERMVHQDFIARIRFSNALPPPPNPPKLLEIPNTGLASGQYTNPGFASRLAREQPLNIEADAELGMPLDLVGMPGVFDGDESSIQPPAHTPVVHPHDRALLRPLGTLGKPKTGEVAVSFLRRTEYIATKRGDAGGALRSNQPKRPGTGPPQRRQLKRPSPEIDEDAGTPAHVKRKIAQSFEAATRDLADPAGRVRHPRQKHLKMTNAYPLLPELESFPDSGAYVTVKFYSAPLAGVQGSDPHKYDPRLASSLFRPVDRTPEEEKRLKLLEDAHARDPDNHPKPSASLEYDLYLPTSSETGAGFRRKFDLDNPQRDDASLYTTASGGADGQGCFQFNHLRRYETSEEVELNHMTKYESEVLVSLTEADGDEGEGERDLPPTAALFYPIMQRTTIRPQRAKQIARTKHLMGVVPEEMQIVDRLDITLEDPTAEMKVWTDSLKVHPRPIEEEVEAAVEEPQQTQQSAGNGGGKEDGSSPAANGGASPTGAAGSEEQDAEGDEEE